MLVLLGVLWWYSQKPKNNSTTAQSKISNANGKTNAVPNPTRERKAPTMTDVRMLRRVSRCERADRLMTASSRLRAKATNMPRNRPLTPASPTGCRPVAKRPSAVRKALWGCVRCAAELDDAPATCAPAASVLVRVDWCITRPPLRTLERHLLRVGRTL